MRQDATIAPLLTWRGFVVALCLSVLLFWPTLASQGYLIFPDTKQYIRGGEIIWNMATDLVLGGAGADAPADGGGARLNERGEPYNVRSFVYSLFTLLAGASVWPAGFPILQAAATIWMLFALLPPQALSQPRFLGAGFLLIAAFSSLPWFAAYLMPDILAAALVIHAAILVRRFDQLSAWQQLVLAMLAAFAAASHYGNMPFAAALFGAVLIWRAVTRRLTVAVVAAALLPVLFAPLANVAASSVALERTSVAPLRLPILLARSLTDGPARWYLRDACPEAPLAFCEAFGEDVPENIPAFLWEEGGIRSVSPAVMARIREEEYLILWRAFRAYPVEQTRSLLGNSALQLVLVGIDQIHPADRGPDGELLQRPEDGRGTAVVAAFDRIVPVPTWAGAACLLLLLVGGRLHRDQREIVAVVVLGLVVNAAIFGGLSAPVDRYQSRIAWLLPALAVIFLAEIRGRSRDQARAPRK